MSVRDAHHLRGVLDQAAAPGVMIIACRRRSSKTLAPFVHERFA